jgi:OOP family OmpA-OmpF porin
MKKFSFALLSAVAMAIALPAAAQSRLSSVYVGGDLGQSKFRDACNGIPGCDDKDTAWGLFAGYQFNRNIGAEIGYHDLGSVSTPLGSIDGTALELVAVGSLPLTTNFSAYGKLGGYRGKLEGLGSSNTNNDLTYGLGLQYDFARNIGVRGEWQRYQDMGTGNGVDVDVMRVGALFRFQ